MVKLNYFSISDHMSEGRGHILRLVVLCDAQGERIESPRVELATDLIVRDSTAAPR